MSVIETAARYPNPRVPDGWRIRGRWLAIDRPLLVGILNVTPDSFSDGGQFDSTDAALAQVERMLAEGADVIDIGGESTRPQGARTVSAAEEMSRVLPIIRAVRGRFATLPISVDTTKSVVRQRQSPRAPTSSMTCPAFESTRGWARLRPRRVPALS